MAQPRIFTKTGAAGLRELCTLRSCSYAAQIS